MSTQYTVRIIYAVAASDRANANSICAAHGLGPNNFSIPLILASDPDTQAARAWGVCIQLTPALAQNLRNAFVAAGIEGRGGRVNLAHWDPVQGQALQKLQEFLASKGWRLKPATAGVV